MQVDLSAEMTTSESLQIGYSRQPLEVRELPEPAEVFHLRRIGLEEFLLFISGPAFIALAMSLGSTIWLVAPLAVSSNGLVGIGWIVVISILLQVSYNVELGRYTLATGESPLIGFGRFPPGQLFWLPVALVMLSGALLWGSGAFAAAEILFTLAINRPPGAADLLSIRLLTVGLLLGSFFLLSFGRRISRTLEITSWATVTFILISLLVVTVTIVPADFSLVTLASLAAFTPAVLNNDPQQLGALVGLAALASGLNFMVISHYRDKGYGMGSLTGAFSGLIGGQKQSLSPGGFTFVANDKSTPRWNYWFRLLMADQWLIYLPGLLAGFILPVVLFRFLFSQAGNVSYYDQNTLVSVAQQLLIQFGPLLFTWFLLIGFAILFLGQTLVLEALARSFTEGLYSASDRVRQGIHNEPRRLYYPILLLFVALISLMVFLTSPTQQVYFAGNVANVAAMIFPLILLYLNFNLPRPARSNWISAILLLANVLFFGLFLVNFAAAWLTGQALFVF
jgi:hypothetical protein